MDARGWRIMQKITWLFTGARTFFTLLTALYQFAPAVWRTPIVLLGFTQPCSFSYFMIQIHNFLVVIHN